MIYGYARCSTNESKQDINRQIGVAELHISCILFRANDGGLACKILRHDNLLFNEKNLVTHGISHVFASCGVAACRLSFVAVVITILIIHTFLYSATRINMRKMYKKPATP